MTKRGHDENYDDYDDYDYYYHDYPDDDDDSDNGDGDDEVQDCASEWRGDPEERSGRNAYIGLAVRLASV